MSTTFTHWNQWFSPTAVQQRHPLLHILLEPCVLLGCWFSPWELWGYWLVHIDVPPMGLETPSAPWVLSLALPWGHCENHYFRDKRTQWLLCPWIWMSQHWRHRAKDSLLSPHSPQESLILYIEIMLEGWRTLSIIILVDHGKSNDRCTQAEVKLGGHTLGFLDVLYIWAAC